MNTASPFVWGSGGKAMSYEELEQQRQIEERLAAQGPDTSPVEHWAQGAARVAQALAGAFRRGSLDKARQENVTANQAKIARILGGGGAPVATADTAPVASPSSSLPTFAGGGSGRAPTIPLAGDENDRAKTVFEGLVNRGLPPVAAAGIAGNFHGESGFNPSIAGDNGTSFGLAQWRGDRLTALKQLAASQGKDWRDIDVQLDHTLAELKGPEAKAYAALQGAQTPEEAASLFMQHYERPAAWAMKQSGPARAAVASQIFSKYGTPVQSAVAPQVATQVASADPSFVPQGAPAPVAAPQAPVVTAQAAPVAASASPGVQRVTQAVQSIDPAILDALTSPQSSPATREIAKIMMQQKVQAQQQAAQQAWDERKLMQQRGWQVQDRNADQAFRRQEGETQRQYDERMKREGWTREDINKQVERDYQTAAPTNDIKEYNLVVKQAQESGQPVPDFATWQQSMRKAGAINVTQNAGGGDDFYKELDKKAATMFSTLDEEGYKAQAKAGQIDRLETLLTAAQNNALPALRQFAGEYGVKTEGLSDIQAAQSLINELVPGQRQPGSGTMSDADLALFKQSLPRIVNQPGGNALIIQTMRGINQYTASQGAIARAVANREITPAEGRDRLAKLDNPLAGFSKTLSDRKDPPPPQEGPAKIGSKADYDKLPAGSQYVAPDGSLRTKK